MTDGRISVIIPVYNTEQYLPRCLDSIINQTVLPLEVIMIDDGSTDKSYEICERYENRYPFISLESQTHEGLVATRKKGLSMAKGEYVTYIDSDDWIERDAIKRIGLVIDSHEPDVISSSFVKEFDGIQTIRKEVLQEGFYERTQINEALEDIVIRIPFLRKIMNSSLCTKTVKKDLLMSFQYRVDDDISYGEGDAVAVPLSLSMKNLYVIEKPYYHYVVRKSSMSWKKHNDRYGQIIHLTRHLSEVLELDNDIKQAYFYFVLYELLLDNLDIVPLDYLRDRKFLPFWNGVTKGMSVIVYGKGMFGKSLVNMLVSTDFCTVLANVDSTDAKFVLPSFPTSSYDKIIIAIADSVIVDEVRNYLRGLEVSDAKISCIEKKLLTSDNFPLEIHSVLNK